MPNRKPQLSTEEKKQMFLFTLPIMLWNVSRACDAVDISRATFYVWLKEDPQFAEDVDLAREERIDFLQEKSLQLVNTLDGAQIRFELNALAKSRGYGKQHSDQPPQLPSQHVHFHLPPQPADLADWEKQTLEARKARHDLQQNLQPLNITPEEILNERSKNEHTEQVKERALIPREVLKDSEESSEGSSGSGEDEEMRGNG